LGQKLKTSLRRQILATRTFADTYLTLEDALAAKMTFTIIA